MSELAERLALLKQRLRSAYDGIGHSHGRPYVYVVYPPEQELTLRRLVDDELRSDAALTFVHLDILPVVMRSTVNQEARRDALLSDPVNGGGAAESLVRVWARDIRGEIQQRVEALHGANRPVVVLRGLAALHPLGTPTGMMEALAEQEHRVPETNQIVPIVLLVPGIRSPQTSRQYLFLGLPHLAQSFYRGEEA